MPARPSTLVTPLLVHLLRHHDTDVPRFVRAAAKILARPGMAGWQAAAGDLAAFGVMGAPPRLLALRFADGRLDAEVVTGYGVNIVSDGDTVVFTLRELWSDIVLAKAFGARVRDLSGGVPLLTGDEHVVTGGDVFATAGVTSLIVAAPALAVVLDRGCDPEV